MLTTVIKSLSYKTIIAADRGYAAGYRPIVQPWQPPSLNVRIATIEGEFDKIGERTFDQM